MPIFTNHPDQKNCVKKCASGRGRPLSISSTLPRRAYQGGISRRGSVGFGRPAAVHVRTPLAAGALNKAASAAAAERQRDAEHRSSAAARGTKWSGNVPWGTGASAEGDRSRPTTGTKNRHRRKSMAI